MLDRLIRGRVWIPLLGVMLAGIVAMQVEVLKLGASMGRSLEANSTLSAQNATLQESVASLADDQRIEQLAASMGMVMPPPSAVGFLSPHGRGVEAKAAATIRQPNPGSFDYLTSGNGSVVTQSSLAAWDSSGLLGSSAASTPSTTSSAPTSSTPTSSTPTSSTTTDATTATATTASDGTTATSTDPTTVAPTSTTSSPTDAAPVPASSSSTTTSDGTASPTTTSDSTTGSSGVSVAPSTGAVAVAPGTTSQGG